MAITRPVGVADYMVERDRKSPVVRVPNFLQPIASLLFGEVSADQIGGVRLIEYMKQRFPEAANDPDAVLIGVTPLDIYYEHEDWRFSFGVRGFYDDPKAVISTFRMNPEAFGDDADPELLLGRARKMTSKYVGLLYYGLQESDDPESPTYNRILSLGDLDKMTEPLPVGDSHSHPTAR